jgi:hypothetical protein
MVIHNRNILFNGAGRIDQQELRFALLLWDRLDFPRNSLFDRRLWEDDEYLLSIGVLQRSRAVFSRGTSSIQLGADLLDGHLRAFRELDRREPGRWSLARGERSISFPDVQLEQGRGFLFQLHQALPIPNRDVALADILDFKRKRRAELLALRHHLEDVYQTVLAAPDRPLAQNTAVERLDAALADHMKVSKETGFRLVLGGLQAKLDLKLVDAAVGVLAASAGTLTGVTDALQAAGLVAAYSIGSSVSLRGRQRSDSPFEYVSLFHRNLF